MNWIQVDDRQIVNLDQFPSVHAYEVPLGFMLVLGFGEANFTYDTAAEINQVIRQINAISEQKLIEFKEEPNVKK